MEQVTNENKGWYAIHTYSGYENKVKTNLEKRIESMNMEDLVTLKSWVDKLVSEYKRLSKTMKALK